MEGYVATKLDEFDRGKISRRRLIEALAFAATTVHATGSAQSQTARPPLQVALINHISYSCPNFRQAADWYSKVFNLDQVNPKATEVSLPFGKGAKGLPLAVQLVGKNKEAAALLALAQWVEQRLA